MIGAAETLQRHAQVLVAIDKIAHAHLAEAQEFNNHVRTVPKIDRDILNLRECDTQYYGFATPEAVVAHFSTSQEQPGATSLSKESIDEALQRLQAVGLIRIKTVRDDSSEIRLEGYIVVPGDATNDFIRRHSQATGQE